MGRKDQRGGVVLAAGPAKGRYRDLSVRAAINC